MGEDTAPDRQCIALSWQQQDRRGMTGHDGQDFSWKLLSQGATIHHVWLKIARHQTDQVDVIDQAGSHILPLGA